MIKSSPPLPIAREALPPAPVPILVRPHPARAHISRQRARERAFPLLTRLCSSSGSSGGAASRAPTHTRATVMW